MKKSLILLLSLVSLSITAQKDCEYSSNIKDSIGSYKATKDYVVYEKVFGNSQTSLFFSLINADGLLSLNLQIVQKSADFIPAKCLDNNSKIYIQLSNGKIITLPGIELEVCGNSVRVNNENCRILSGYFLFTKETLNDLKTYPISFFRIKYSGENIDYITKEVLVSEVDKKTYNPDHFFMDYLKCVE
jgi:hypothetical protein